MYGIGMTDHVLKVIQQRYEQEYENLLDCPPNMYTQGAVDMLEVLAQELEVDSTLVETWKLNAEIRRMEVS